MMPTRLHPKIWLVSELTAVQLIIIHNITISWLQDESDQMKADSHVKEILQGRGEYVCEEGSNIRRAVGTGIGWKGKIIRYKMTDKRGVS
jgi:hypothetical protein